jgi:hypothetical protein
MTLMFNHGSMLHACWSCASRCAVVLRDLSPELLPWPLVRDTIEYGRWDYHCGSYVLLLVIPDFVHASVEGRFSGDGTVSLIA